MTTILDEWARDWSVGAVALADLRNRLTPPEPVVHPTAKSEAAVSQQVRLDASRRGMILTRNNVGAMEDENGRWLRFGLWNESKAMNEKFKSPDFVGIDPVLITSAHVGKTIGQFIAPEVKHAGWHFTGTEREVAQRNCHDLIVSKGGRAGFVTGAGQI